jgi:hypothetical protein
MTIYPKARHSVGEAPATPRWGFFLSGRRAPFSFKVRPLHNSALFRPTVVVENATIKLP